MNDLDSLLEQIRTSDSPLVKPRGLEHSLELKDGLPPVRRHVGPGAWYQALDASASGPASDRSRP